MASFINIFPNNSFSKKGEKKTSGEKKNLWQMQICGKMCPKEAKKWGDVQ